MVFFLTVLLFVSYSLLRDTAVNNAQDLSLTILIETYKQIDSFFDEIEHLARQMSGYPAFYEVRTGEMRTIILSAVRARNEYLRAIYLGTKEGEMYEWGIGEGFVDNAPVFEPGYDPRLRPWYREAVEAGDFTITKPYVYASVEAVGITGVMPVLDPGGNFVGVLGLDIMLDDLKTMIEELKLQKGGRVILLNQSDRAIVNQFEARNPGGKELVLRKFRLFDPEEVAAAQQSLFVTTFENNEKFFISSTTNANTGWKLFVALPYDQVMEQANDNIKFLVFIDVMLMALLSVVIGFLSNLIIIHPLEATVDVMKRIEQGESDARVPVSREDELGILAKQFNRMIDIVNDYRLSLEEKVRQRTEENAVLQQENVRLRIIEEKERIYGYLHDSLGARLTNIFISNNVAQSTVENDPKVLRDMLQQIERNTQLAIEDLKEILFSSQSEDRKMIDFPKILKRNIHERLKLKGIRLSYTINNPEMLNELDRETRFEIEKILQELVSNVLKHSEAKRVELSLDVENEEVKICFADNGIGLPEGELPPASSGFGLKNMQHRIENFGGRFSLSSEGKGLKIEISLPATAKEYREP